MTASRREAALAEIRRAAARLRKAGDSRLANVFDALLDSYGTPTSRPVNGGRADPRSWREVRLRLDLNSAEPVLWYGVARGKLRSMSPVPKAALQCLLACEGNDYVPTSVVNRNQAHAARKLLRKLFDLPGNPLRPDRRGSYWIRWGWARLRRHEIPMTDLGADPATFEIRD